MATRETLLCAWFEEKGHEFTRAVNACNKDVGFSRCLSPLMNDESESRK